MFWKKLIRLFNSWHHIWPRYFNAQKYINIFDGWFLKIIFFYSKRENFGEDLLALNIQRGRDHGLPGYNAYRKACGLRSLTDWSQRPTELNEEMWTKIEEVYDHVDDIDVYIGGIAETRYKCFSFR